MKAMPADSFCSANLGEQKVLENAFSGFQRAENLKLWRLWDYLQDIMG